MLCLSIAHFTIIIAVLLTCTFIGNCASRPTGWTRVIANRFAFLYPNIRLLGSNVPFRTPNLQPDMHICGVKRPGACTIVAMTSCCCHNPDGSSEHCCSPACKLDDACEDQGCGIKSTHHGLSQMDDMKTKWTKLHAGLLDQEVWSMQDGGSDGYLHFCSSGRKLKNEIPGI